jgi:ferredoxin
LAKAAVHRITLTNRGGAVVECAGDETIYEACLRAGIQLPIACEYGGCITCACILTEGKVRQPGATAINKRQSKAGYILPCVARPKADCTVEVGVESHQTLYANPFAKTVTRQF